MVYSDTEDRTWYCRHCRQHQHNALPYCEYCGELIAGISTLVLSGDEPSPSAIRERWQSMSAISDDD